MSDWPPIKKGTFVRAVIDETRDRGYTSSAKAERVLHNEMVGEVVGHSDSHGLCYEIRFPSGATAWFDHDELREST